MVRMSVSSVVFFSLLALTHSKEISRSKRQLNMYYVCGNSPNTYASTYPCSTSSNGCGYSSCRGFSSTGILPTSFYNPSTNCNSGCSNLNCNQYNGQWINGQYVAYTYGSNQYSPCASSCCGNSNTNYNYNNLYNNNLNNNLNYQNTYPNSYPNTFPNGVYNPYDNSNNGGVYNPYDNNNNGDSTFNPRTMRAPGPVVNPNGQLVVGGIGLGDQINAGGNIGTNNGGRFNQLSSTGVGQCGGIEASSGYCSNGFCTNGMQCVQGNLCCRCAVGASNGMCSHGAGCPTGYSCSQNGYCCASVAYNGIKLEACVNKQCTDGFECGSGDLCYPINGK